MPYDPTNKTHRKPRRLGNTPLGFYVRLNSLGITCMVALMMYLYWRKNVLPHVNDERYKIELDKLKEQHEMAHDYATSPFLRNIIDKLTERQERKEESNIAAQTKESKNIETTL